MGGTAIRIIKEMQNSSTLSPYISYKNWGRKLESFIIEEVNEYYNWTYFREDYNNRTRDIPILIMRDKQDHYNNK